MSKKGFQIPAGFVSDVIGILGFREQLGAVGTRGCAQTFDERRPHLHQAAASAPRANAVAPLKGSSGSMAIVRIKRLLCIDPSPP
jgi:hypothetical protein